MSVTPASVTQYLLQTVQAADGRALYDVVDANQPGAATLYRTPDRAHAQAVADDLATGVLDPAAVRRVYLELIAMGWHRPAGGLLGYQGFGIFKKKPVGTVWQQAEQRIVALRNSRAAC